jgi:predicted nucleotide-binding protein (sugar kinase/HSP70/actin superfamily)
VYETSLSLLHNDLCIPAHLFLGIFLHTIFTLQMFDPAHSAIVMTQTASACRASNYLSCARRALRDVGFPKLPVIPLTTISRLKGSHPGVCGGRGVDVRPSVLTGFPVNMAVYRDAAICFTMGDLLQRLLLRCRPSRT